MLRANMLNIAWFGVWALGGLLLVALVGLLALELWFGGCSDERRAVLEEFPHHGDRPIEPYSGEASCNVGYPTDATREEVLAYYDGQLRENSWEVMGFWAADHPPKGVEFYGEGLPSVSGAPESVGGGLGAKRGNYRYYRVTYEPPGTGDPGGETPAGEEVSTEDAQVVVEVTEEPGGGFPK